MSELMPVMVLAAVIGGLPLLAYLGVRIVREPVVGVYIFVFLSSITEMPALPVVGDRLAVADFVMLFTILVTLIQGVLLRRAPPGLRLVDQLGLLFIVLATISSLLALIVGGEPVRVVLFLIIYVYGYLCFRLIVRLIDRRERFYRVCFSWAAGAALVIVVGFLAATGVYKPAWTYDPVIMRINSTMKMSGQVSSYVAPAMFVLFFVAASRRIGVMAQIIAILLISAGALVLIGTGSRISFIMLLFVILYALLAIRLTSGAQSRQSLIAVAALVGGSIFSGFVVSVWTDTSEEYALLKTSPFERAIRIFSETSRHEDADISDWGGNRYREIPLALQNFEKHPLLGVGSGMFSSTYQVKEIHNTYISILAENGVLSFIIFAVWWLMILYLILREARGLRGQDRLLLRLAFGAMLALSMYQATTNGMRQRPFWFVPAICLAAVVIVRHRSEEDGSVSFHPRLSSSSGRG